jgi:hypothetical protein
MKKTVFAALACVALAGTSFAGTYYAPSKEVKEMKEIIPIPETCFADTEFQLDFFGTYNWTIDPNQYHDNAGGGVGANFFFARYIGIGADTNVFSGGANGVWQSTGSLILRYPIDSACLAPYIFGGGGYQYDGHGEGTWHAGGGLEYRVVPHSVGLFTEGRYTWAEDNDTAQIRAGLRVVF